MRRRERIGRRRRDAAGARVAQPRGDGLAGRVVATWDAVAGATAYHVALSRAPGIAANTNALPGEITVRVTTGTSLELTGLWDGGPYYVVARGVSAAGEGPYSVERSAYPIPLPPIMVSLSGTASAVRVAWPPVVGATSYGVFLAADPTVSSTNWASLPAGQQASTSSTTVTISGLDNGTTYWAVVCASNPSGASADSAAGSGVPTARGTFEVGDAVPVGATPQGSATALIDADGILDLVVVDSDASTVSVFLGNGDGTFHFDAAYPTESGPVAVLAIDLDADGALDLVTANSSGSVSVLDSDGMGGFEPHVDWYLGGSPASLCHGQLNPNLDGTLDVVVTDAANAQVLVLYGTGDTTFSSLWGFSTGAQPRACHVADVDADGFDDILTANDPAGSVTALLSDGYGDFPTRRDSAIGLACSAIDVGDFDSDGVLDVVVTSTFASSVSFLHGNGDGTFLPFFPVPAGSLAGAVVAGDFDGDGFSDLIVVNAGDGSVVLLRGDGAGHFLPFSDTMAGIGASDVTVGDFNGDGILDVAVTTPGTGDVTILLGSP